MANGTPVKLDFSKAQPIALDFSKAQPMTPASLQTQGIGPELPTNMSIQNYPLATRVKDSLKRMLMGTEASLPALGAGTAVALTPATGGASDALLAAILGGAAGTNLKQLTAHFMHQPNAPKDMKQAIGEEELGGLEQGEYEAGGRVLDSILGRWAGSRVAAASRKRLADLTAMAGPAEETSSNITKVLPDLDQTVATLGHNPRTPRDVLNVVQRTSDRLDQQFNQELFRIGKARVMPKEIADRIRAEITPDMRMTAEGRAEAKELQQAALEYERPWTLNQLNSKRMTNNARLSAFYKRESQGQATALSAAQTKIMKSVRDGAAEIVYDVMNSLPNSSIDARLLKQKQGALWDLSDQLDERIDKLTNAQLNFEGRTLRQKVQPSAYLSDRNIHGYFRGLGDLIPGGGPERQAITQARKGFRPSRALSRQAVIAATPLANFLRASGVYSNLNDQEGQDAH